MRGKIIDDLPMPPLQTPAERMAEMNRSAEGRKRSSEHMKRLWKKLSFRMEAKWSMQYLNQQDEIRRRQTAGKRKKGVDKKQTRP